MFLEIVSPESQLFSSEVESIYVPGVNGEFEMLNNHAAIVSTLKEGTIKVKVSSTQNSEDISDKFEVNGNEYALQITSGTIELKDNKAIILVD